MITLESQSMNGREPREKGQPQEQNASMVDINFSAPHRPVPRHRRRSVIGKRASGGEHFVGCTVMLLDGQHGLSRIRCWQPPFAPTWRAAE